MSHRSRTSVFAKYRSRTAFPIYFASAPTKCCTSIYSLRVSEFTYSVLRVTDLLELTRLSLYSTDVLDKSELSAASNQLLLESIYSHLNAVHTKELVICGQEVLYLIRNLRKISRHDVDGKYDGLNLRGNFISRLSCNNVRFQKRGGSVIRKPRCIRIWLADTIGIA